MTQKHLTIYYIANDYSNEITQRKQTKISYCIIKPEYNRFHIEIRRYKLKMRSRI